jgi:hypothetical protein
MWVGRAPPAGAGYRHAASIEVAVVQSPLPLVLVIDPVDDHDQSHWLQPTPRALAMFGLVLCVPEVTGQLTEATAAAGLAGCLPRGCEAGARHALLSMVQTFVAGRRGVVSVEATLQACGSTLRRGAWTLKSPSEAEALATVLAASCPEPERRVGGLLELLINAIEHGNLEITGPGKRLLLAEGRWYDELMARLADERWASRSVHVTFERSAEGISFSIEDEGAGFDFAEVLERQLDANDTRHGRGIALARMMSFDELTWQGRGNKVTGKIRP